MKTKNTIIVALTICLIYTNTSFSQQIITDSTDLSNFSLEELMKNKSKANPSVMDTKIASAIEVASSKPLVLRKSPAILSVITAEEIKHSGARNLIDILNTVPGLDFGVDVQGVIGLSVRGNWANEGKVLLLLDGLELNETVYGTLQLGNSFPLDNIKRIEIIRGPGSAIYGGFAEYAVINIITFNENDATGIKFGATSGWTKNINARNTYSLSIAKKINNIGFNINSFWGSSVRSDQNYSDIFGNEFDMSKNSDLNSLNFNAGLNYKNLSIKAIYFQNSIQSRDGYEQAYLTPFKVNFNTFAVEVKNNFKISDKFTFTPKLSFKSNTPWEVKTDAEGDPIGNDEMVYMTKSNRYKLNLTSVFDATKNINITFGAEGFNDVATKFTDDVFRNSNTNEVTYLNGALFSQVVAKNKIINIIAGARYDFNSSFGSSFVPRIGLTKKVESFNFKILYSQAFKAPVIENVETSFKSEIKPEKTSILELETGYQLTKNMFLTLNLFDITTKNTIIYFVDTSFVGSGTPDGYINAESSGSQGVELEYKIANKWSEINFGYSYYTIQNKSNVTYYETPFKNYRSLGLANHKICVNATLNITKDWFINASLIYKSKKTGITDISEEGEYLYQELPENYIINLNIGKDNVLIKNMYISFGVHNMLNQQLWYVQPYSSGHAPLPEISREFLVKLSYKF